MTAHALQPAESDAALLERFVAGGVEAAFRQVVERHAGLVLGVARRQLGDEEEAREVAQRVFILLARKAPLLRRHPSLTGWLFSACRLQCRARRRDAARQARLMRNFAGHQETAREAGFPAQLLDEAMEQLPEPDRGVLLARYYEGCSFSDIAAGRRVSEPAARKQVSRALERLAKILGSGGGATAFTATAPADISPALASVYMPGPAMPPPGAALLAEAALRSVPLVSASTLTLFMTAKSTLITAAALVWIASIAGGWQAGLRSTTALEAGAAPAIPGSPAAAGFQETRPLRPPPGQGSPVAGKVSREVALRDLIALIAADMEAAPWDNVAGIRAKARLTALSDADAAEALAVAMKLSDPPAALLDALWLRRGKSEKLAALHAALELPPGSAAQAARLSVLGGWAQSDPAAALEWVLSRPQDIRYGLESVFQAWSAQDAAGSFRAVAALTNPDQRIAALRTWCYTATDSSQRAELMDAVLATPEAKRGDLLEAAAAQWKDQPAAYAAWLTEHGALSAYGNRPLSALCNIWTQSDPAAAVDWLRRNAGQSGEFPQLLDGIVSNWAMVDAPAASEWLNTQPVGPELDPSIRSLIGTLPPNESEAIKAWAARMHDQGMAQSILRMRKISATP